MLKRSGFKRKANKPLKRTKLARKSKSETAQVKDHIQAWLRLGVTKRDGGCILRNIRHCGGEASVIDNKVVSEKVIQADHLVTRSNSASYADIRLVVCVCTGCHFWKKYHKEEYDDLVKTVLDKERVSLWERMEQYRREHRTEKVDWKLQLAALQMIVKEL
jgi:hypothetical protein